MLAIILILIIVFSLMWDNKKPQSNFNDNNESGDIDLSHCVTKLTWKADNDTLTLKEPSFNTSRIIDYGKDIKQFIYRPQTLDQFIGQTKAKEEVKMFIKLVRQLRPSHIFLNGWAGCGKTSLVYIIKNILNAKMIYRIPESISDPDALIDTLNEINKSSEDFVILFLDEIHQIKSNIAEKLYPIMEDFRIDNKRIRPFILAGATTDKDILVKKISPFIDRFQTQITLSKYDPPDLFKIIKQYKEQLYNDINIPEENLTIISQNSKRTPRIAISLLLKNLVEKDIDKVLTNSNIIKDGLTEVDINILKVLEENKKPMGSSALAQRVNIPVSDYLVIYEPYLVSEGFVSRTPQRMIGEKGLEILGNINK
jgi:Holliday junction DNA helicase RuvB